MSEQQAGSAPPPRKDPSPLAQMAECVHRQALETVRLRGEVADLHHRLAAVDAAGAAAEIADLRARLAATEAELERLRSLPELRAGQRLRHSARRSASRPVAREDARRDPVVDGREAGHDAGDARPAGERGEVAVGAPDDEIRATADEGLGYPEPQLSAIVIVRNRRGGLARSLDWLVEHGVERIEIVDDATSDPVTLETLTGLGRTVHRLDAPLGELGPWALGLVAELALREPVLVADADTVPAAECPDDALARLANELARRPDLDAVGLGATVPSGAVTGPPLFRLVRSGLPHLPSEYTTLDAPYTASRASWDAPDDDPGERFARQADGVTGA